MNVVHWVAVEHVLLHRPGPKRGDVCANLPPRAQFGAVRVDVVVDPAPRDLADSGVPADHLRQLAVDTHYLTDGVWVVVWRIVLFERRQPVIKHNVAVVVEAPDVLQSLLLPR